jgi:hypothetical protein
LLRFDDIRRVSGNLKLIASFPLQQREINSSGEEVNKEMVEPMVMLIMGGSLALLASRIRKLRAAKRT